MVYRHQISNIFRPVTTVSVMRAYIQQLYNNILYIYRSDLFCSHSPLHWDAPLHGAKVRELQHRADWDALLVLRRGPETRHGTGQREEQDAACSRSGKEQCSQPL